MSEENNAIFKQEWAYVEFYELVELIANNGIPHCKFQKIQNFDELYETQLNRFFELMGIK